MGKFLKIALSLVISNLFFTTNAFSLNPDRLVLQSQPIFIGGREAVVYLGVEIIKGVAFDVFMKGSQKIYKRLNDSNRVEYQAPTNEKCGYVTEYTWSGRIKYRRICK